jgi:RimJ/RimL family protein N-acetyltransferase
MISLHLSTGQGFFCNIFYVLYYTVLFLMKFCNTIYFYLIFQGNGWLFMKHQSIKSQKPLFTLRVPGKKDAKKALAYIRAVTGETEFLDLSPDDISFSLKEETDYIMKMTTSPGSMLFIAEKEKEIAGIVSINGVLTMRRKHIGVLGLSVRKVYWHKGIGTALLERILKWAGNNTLLKKIMLHVHEENHIAIRLYKKHGFVQEGTLHMDRFTGNKYHSTIVMGLILE